MTLQPAPTTLAAIVAAIETRRGVTLAPKTESKP